MGVHPDISKEPDKSEVREHDFAFLLSRVLWTYLRSDFFPIKVTKIVSESKVGFVSRLTAKMQF